MIETLFAVDNVEMGMVHYLLRNWELFINLLFFIHNLSIQNSQFPIPKLKGKYQ